MYEMPRNPNAAAAEIASQCACFSVRKAARAVTQLYDKTLEPSGLQVTQFTLLVAVSLSEQLTVSQVAERLVMDRTTLTRNVAPLERDGLVKRKRGPDRRERYLRVTPAGRRRMARLSGWIHRSIRRRSPCSGGPVRRGPTRAEWDPSRSQTCADPARARRRGGR
jgi:DNA-binding MarR family transcriptional regulator